VAGGWVVKVVPTANCSCGTLQRFLSPSRLYDYSRDTDYTTMDQDDNAMVQDYNKIGKHYNEGRVLKMRN
jgi:hypothetical protein